MAINIERIGFFASGSALNDDAGSGISRFKTSTIKVEKIEFVAGWRQVRSGQLVQ